MAGRFTVDTVFRAIDRMSVPIKSMKRSLDGLRRSGDRSFKSLNRRLNSFNSGLLNTLGVMRDFAIRGIGAVSLGLFGLIRAASRVEDAEAAFTPLLGGAENAKRAIKDLQTFAAKTPFELKDLTEASKILLGFQAATQDTLIPTLNMLGDAAGGNAERVKNLANVFGQVTSLGKADLKDLRQFINAGVPIVGALAKIKNVNARSILKLTSKGRISADDITAALKMMTKEGGIFFQGMELASRTQTGLFSNLLDNLNITASLIGADLLPITKRYTTALIDLTGKIREWVSVNKEILGQDIETIVSFITRNLGNMGKVLGGLLTLMFKWLVLTVAIKVATQAWNTVIFATRIAMIAWAGIVAITNGMLGAQAFLLNANRISMGLWVAGFIIAKGVMLAFNIVMFAAKLVMAGFALVMNLAIAPVWLIIGAIAALIAIGALLYMNWDSISEFFIGIWDGMVDKVKSSVDTVLTYLKKMVKPFADIFGGAFSLVTDFDNTFGDGLLSTNKIKSDNAESGFNDLLGGNFGAGNNIVSPSEIVSKSISERTNFVEMTVKDETGRVQIPNLDKSLGVDLNLINTGGLTE